MNLEKYNRTYCEIINSRSAQLESFQVVSKTFLENFTNNFCLAGVEISYFQEQTGSAISMINCIMI